MLYLLKLLLTYNIYKEYNEIIYTLIKDNIELTKLYRYIQKLQTTYNKDISIEELSFYVLTHCPEKDKEFFSLLLQKLNEEDIDNLVFEDTFNSITKQHNAYQLAVLAFEVSEGKKDYEQLLEFIQKLDTPIQSISTDIAFVESDLDILKNESFSTPGLRWRLNCLNRSLGSLRKGDFGFLFARPESFSRDTEVLTPSGWITVDKVTKDTYIAQVCSNLTTSFIKPQGIHPHEQTHCYHIYDELGRVDLIVTDGHGMIYEKEGKLWKERADTVKYYQGIKHHVASASSMKEEVDFLPEHRLAIAYQADGHTRNYKEYGYTFSFKKERKQQRLKEILKECNYEYTEYKDGNRGHKGYYVISKIRLYKNFDWINLSLISKDWCIKFIEELSYWDATRRTECRFKFDTIDKNVADKVQAIAILAGYNCLLSIHIDDRNPNYNNIYSLSIRTSYKPVDGQCIKKERILFKDTTFCFEVPTGMLLVRRNGAVAVCGNTGKTTFLASEITHFATQCNSPILWFNNEEQGSKVQLRIHQAFAGRTLLEIFNNTTKYKDIYEQQGGSNIKVYDSALINRNDVERICLQYSPACIIFDQLDKIQGFSADREDLRLGNIYIWARELAKKYCPVIGVCQSDATGEGRRWLEMDNVANAKTAKQAEADWIVGIGKTHSESEEAFRYLSICKNKLIGDSDSDPAMRHAKLQVKLQPEIARYLD